MFARTAMASGSAGLQALSDLMEWDVLSCNSSDEGIKRRKSEEKKIPKSQAPQGVGLSRVSPVNGTEKNQGYLYYGLGSYPPMNRRAV
jgi:hypothetical protein